VLYLVKDHLGSIHTTANESGLVSGSTSMDFGPFGERRNINWSGPLATVFQKLQNVKTTRGFTGHEHSDGLGIIHMNGRIYDPKLGRFLQADPFVQAPKYSQSLNRYSYVFNNPLSYTDPSGHFSLNRFIKKWWRVIGATVVSYVTYGAASEWAAGWALGKGFGTTAAGYVGALIGGSVAGFVGGVIIAGTLKGAFRGAVAGGLLGGVAGYFADTYSLARIAADGLAGGITAEWYGQKFRDGLLFGALVSSATYISVRLRANQKMRSEQFPGQVGESDGFRGIEGKIAGERTYEQYWIDSGAAQDLAEGRPIKWVIENKYIPYKKKLSPLGGLQGGEGLLFGKSYKSGGLIDYILEGYSGVHDTLNEPFFYAANGTNRILSGFWERTLGYIINPTNVLLASPIVLPALVPDYVRHFYFQDADP
jgi:RHS repeat-associated protein